MFTNAMRDALISGLLNIFKDNIEAIILYGSVARKDNTAESDIDVAIILKKEIDDKTRETFIQWSADMDLQYDRVFSIIDIQEMYLDLLNRYDEFGFFTKENFHIKLDSKENFDNNFNSNWYYYYV